MGGHVPNLVNVKGTVQRVTARKQKGDTYILRNHRVACEAARLGASYYAVRAHGVWGIYPIHRWSGEPLVAGLSEDAAAMWLQHRGRRD